MVPKTKTQMNLGSVVSRTGHPAQVFQKAWAPRTKGAKPGGHRNGALIRGGLILLVLGLVVGGVISLIQGAQQKKIYNETKTGDGGNTMFLVGPVLILSAMIPVGIGIHMMF
jgi:hypothetical protein